ncbi:hypothetical protein [Psychroflexus sp. ALD_RP9]|uniref:hypothetical protein n=1 Tax=Psychroflexus sp. ALD_RP9 TaxID=2777186 RepID=UPI001A8D4EBC|nr:hypothetical protein [Psychroflexus sp. ALD_RP9]QSS97931.1 hypothetical protein IMZ30_04250 [Psychroflexus sp. ALD_RP9]
MLILLVVNRFFEPIENYNLMYWCYGFNGLITSIYLALVLLLGELFKHQIGFIFLGFASVKIALFLILKYYKAIEIEASQFIAFFLPYFASVVYEIIVTKQILDKLSFKE